MGNLTGILTFALVVWASIVYCYRSFRDFEQEMHEMQHRVQLALEETARIRRAFIERQRMSPSRRLSQTTAGDDEGTAPGIWEGARASYSHHIDEAWARAEREMIKAAKFVNKRLLKPTTVLGMLRNRTVYVVERGNAAETVAKLERALENNIKGIVAYISGQISTETEFRLVQMEADLARLRRQNQDLCELVKQTLYSITVSDLQPRKLSMDSP